MKNFFKGLLIFSGILLFSAFLAPLIYQIHPFKFERILSRLIMVFVLAWLLIKVRWRQLDYKSMGLEWSPQTRKQLLTGFLIGFLTLLLLTAVMLLFKARVLVFHFKGFPYVLYKPFEYIFSALLVGVIEEVFFRYFIFSRLRVRFSLTGSLIGANLIYAGLHFFKGGQYPVPADPGFLDSLSIMLHLLDPFRDPVKLLPTFLSLFMFGYILSYCYLKLNSLYLSIGLHAGCVFLLKIDGWFVESAADAPAWFFGDKNLYNGGLGFLFLIGLFFFMRKAVIPFFAKTANA